MIVVTNDSMHIRLNKLVSLLQVHDWYYDYSDDASAWYKGNASYKEISSLVDMLGESGVDLYNKYSPEPYRGKYDR